jgi:hypothetical protein
VPAAAHPPSLPGQAGDRLPSSFFIQLLISHAGSAPQVRHAAKRGELKEVKKVNKYDLNNCFYAT